MSASEFGKNTLKQRRPKSADPRSKRTVHNHKDLNLKKSVKINEDSTLATEQGTRPDIVVTKKRPSSVPIRKVRPHSASHCVVEDDSSKLQFQASFTRSLRLLGLQTTDLMPSRQPRPKPPRVDGPSFLTRLPSRCVSVENIRDARDLIDRRALAAAVYQEWYFSRIEDERQRRAKEIVVKQRQQQENEQRKADLKVKADLQFSLWLESKEREATAEARKKQQQRQKETEKLKQDAERIQKALTQWNAKKASQLKLQEKAKREKEQKETEKKRKDEQEKQQLAQEAYSAWLKHAKEEKRKQLWKEQKALVAKEIRREKTLERKLQAASSYESWNNIKTRSIKAQLSRIKLANERASQERQRRLCERVYEAEQAYSEWLEKLEDRELFSHSRGGESPWS